MGRDPAKERPDEEARSIIAGGSFIRASYRLSPLSEDIKNAIIALFQFVPEGQRMSGPVSVDAIDGMATIHTGYGDVCITRMEHPVNRKLQTKYIFTVPMQFFIKGRRTDGRFYREVEKALLGLAECRFTFVDSQDGMRHTTNTGIINDPETLSPLKGGDGRNSIVTFSMTKSMIEIMFNSTFGFHKFVERECMSLTSIYAKRIYEILCSQNGGTVYRMEVENFKEMFCITGKYNQRSDLVKRVLEPAKNEINEKTSLTIDYGIARCTTNPRTRIIEFRVLRNSTLLSEHELRRRYLVWPSARIESFMKGVVKMKRSEMLPHMKLFEQASKVPSIMAELPRKWEKTCERIPEGSACEETVRRERIAHIIASVKGMLDDCGLL